MALKARLDKIMDGPETERLLEGASETEGEALLKAIESAPDLAAGEAGRAAALAADLAALIASARVVAAPCGTYRRRTPVSPQAFNAYIGLLDVVIKTKEPLSSEARLKLAGSCLAAAEAALKAEFHTGILAERARALFSPEELRPLLDWTGSRMRDAALRAERRWQCWNMARLLTGWAWESAANEALELTGPREEDAEFLWMLLADLAGRNKAAFAGLMAGGKLPKQPVPPVELLFAYMCEDRGALMSPEPVPNRAAAAALACAGEEALALFVPGAELPRLLSAVLLAPAMSKNDASFARAAEPLLLGLLTDGRSHTGRIPVRPNERAPAGETFTLSAMALNAYLELTASKTGPALEEAFALGVKRVLSGAATMKSADRFVLAASGSPAALRRVGLELAAAVADRSAPAGRRITAYEILKNSAGNRNRPCSRPHLDAPLQKAATVLVWELENPGADPELVRYARANLAGIEPAAVERLQEDGVIGVEGIPHARTLICAGGYPDPEKIRLAAVQATPAQALEALAGGSQSLAIAAAWLAPELALRSDWKPLAGALLKWIASDRKIKLGEGGSAVTLDFGEIMAKQFRALLGSKAAGGDPEALALLLEGFELLLSGHCERSEGKFCLFDLASDLAGFRRAELRSGLEKRAGDRSRPATLRFRAFYQLLCMGFSREAVDMAVKAMLDPLEDPGYKALLGTLLLNYRPEALDCCLDKASKPWKMKDFPGDLPLSVPPDDVPAECLAAGARLAPDRETAKKALGALAHRLRIEKAGDMAPAREALLLLLRKQGEGLLAALRAAADGAPPPGAARIVRPDSPAAVYEPLYPAAQLLALLGGPRDRARVARCALEGTWVPFSFPGPQWTSLAALLNAYDSVNACGGVWSSLDPYILAGYGAAADLVRAQALFQLARKHALEFRPDRAKKTLAFAASLDPSLKGRDLI